MVAFGDALFQCSRPANNQAVRQRHSALPLSAPTVEAHRGEDPVDPSLP
jgi:hypothetical protein